MRDLGQHAIEFRLSMGGGPFGPGIGDFQICADVLQTPISIVASDQCCALGSAIAAAVAGGAHPTMAKAQAVMASKIERTVKPNKKLKKTYDTLYARYQALGTTAG